MNAHNMSPAVLFEHKAAGRPCRVCTSRETEQLLVASHSWVENAWVDYFKCHDCGCLFTDVSGDAYQAIDQAAGFSKFYLEAGAGLEPMVRMLEDGMPEGVRSYADVGCGAGLSLDYMRMQYGVDVIGFEPNSYGRPDEICEHVIHRPLDQAWLRSDPRRFDLILSCEVVEHVDSPLRFLNNLRCALAQSSSRVILSTPNAAAIVPGRPISTLYPMLYPGEHKILFSASALTRLLERAGLHHIDVRDAGADQLVVHAQPARSGSTSRVKHAQDPYQVYLRRSVECADAKVDSALHRGNSFRLLKSLVAAGQWHEARQFLDGSQVLRAFTDEASLVSDSMIRLALEAGSPGELYSACPAFISSLAYHLAMLAALEGRGADAVRGLSGARRLIAHEIEVAGQYCIETHSLRLPCFKEHALALARIGEHEQAMTEWQLLMAEGDAEADFLARAGVQLCIELNAHGRYDDVGRVADSLQMPRLAGAQMIRALDAADRMPDDLARLSFDYRICMFYRALHRGEAALARRALEMLVALAGVNTLDAASVLETCSRDLAALEVRHSGAQVQPPLTFVHFIDEVWCDIHGAFVKGWVHARDVPVTAVSLKCLGQTSPATLHARPDVVAHYPDHPLSGSYGFSCYIACRPFEPLLLCIETPAGHGEISVRVPERLRVPALAPITSMVDEHKAVFAAEMKRMGGRVAVIGGRYGDTNPDTWADCLLPECELVRVDIHPGKGVDVVADAHCLSKALEPGSLDGVVSMATLEHLQAPWLVAAEINRVLKVGGLTLHDAPHSWPLHDQPNDFWRFSHEGLRVLFGPETGFEVLAADMYAPARIYPAPGLRSTSFASIEMPLFDGYGGALILSRKVADIPESSVRWPSSEQAMRNRAETYPWSGSGREG